MIKTMAEKKKLGNPLVGMVKYFKEVKSELKKVSWPTLKQIKNNTIIVLVCILVIGSFIWILDFSFQETLGRVVNNFQSSEQSLPMNDYDIDYGNDTLPQPEFDEEGFMIDEAGERILGENGEPVTMEDYYNAMYGESEIDEVEEGVIPEEDSLDDHAGHDHE